MYKISIPTIILSLLAIISCNSQDLPKEPTKSNQSNEIVDKLLSSTVAAKAEPHRYGGWYCPDNFGFVPVDIQKLEEVPAIADRLPTEQELKDHKSLIKVDTEKYPDARALPMDLPRVAQVFTNSNGMNELVIVIQAIVVEKDTVVGYRFVNGGNGSARIGDVTFLSENEVKALGSQPFFYRKSGLKASKEDIWNAMTKTDYFQSLGTKFDQKEFFSSNWTAGSETELWLNTKGEKAKGYVGTFWGNTYLQIDYNFDGFHYSEKLLIMENHENGTTELFFAAGPFPKDFKKQNAKWSKWFKSVEKGSSK